MNRVLLSVMALVASCALWASDSKKGEPRRLPTHSAGRPSVPPKVEPSEPDASTKIVKYAERDIVRLRAALRFTTVIMLPKSEQILDYACGDKDAWVVNGSQNIAYVKPAKAGAQTNLNLVTASGNIYSFVLVESSEIQGVIPDLKVFVEPKGESMLAAASAAPVFVPVHVVDDYRQQVAIAKEETRRAKEEAQNSIDAGVSKFISNVRFPYRFDAGKKPFLVRAMYHDDKFTYIQARPEETPALYELLDGKPNLVNFEYRNGAYVVQKILDKGYLAIGKQRLAFRRED